jgi:hypothetical protein
MNFIPTCLRVSCVVLLLLVSSCGGKGSSAPPPAGGITVTPGNGSVTLTWNATPGVQYWFMYAQTANPIDIKTPPPGKQWVYQNVGGGNLTSPYVLTGLTNGLTYSFAMNARTDGGPGGDQTASVSAVPRMAGGVGSWTVSDTRLTGDVLGASAGIASDTLTYNVAVGSAGAYRSVDGGLTWLPAGVSPPVNLRAVTYATVNSVNKFFAVGNDGGANKIYSSTDLQTWYPATTVPAGTGLNALGFDGVNLVAVGNSGQVLASPNGDVWATQASAGSSTLRGVVYANNLWVTVSQNGEVFTSSNIGSAWSLAATTLGNSALNGVAVTPGYAFIAVGASGKVLTWSGGSSWTENTVTPANDLYAVTADGAQYMAVGLSGVDGTAGAFTSPGPDVNQLWTWTAQSTGVSTNAWRAVYGSASAYVAVGLGGVTATSK